MELEEFVGEYLLRNPKSSGNIGRLEYEYKLKEISDFFLELKQKGFTQHMQVDDARLCVLFYEKGIEVGEDCERNGISFRN